MDRLRKWISSLFDVPLKTKYRQETQVTGDELANEYKKTTTNSWRHL